MLFNNIATSPRASATSRLELTVTGAKVAGEGDTAVCVFAAAEGTTADGVAATEVWADGSSINCSTRSPSWAVTTRMRRPRSPASIPASWPAASRTALTLL
jgi:hypothetical protein